MMSIGMPYSIANVAKVWRAQCVVRFLWMLHIVPISLRYEFIFWLLGIGNNFPLSCNSGLCSYFCYILSGLGRSGTRLISEVFSRGLCIHVVPLSSVVMCCFRKLSASVKASPVSAQKQNTSRIHSSRSLGISLLINMSSSSFVNGTLTFVLSIFIL